MRFRDWKMPRFIHKEHHRYKSEYGWNVWHLTKLKLGKNTDIGYGTLLFAHHGITIGDNVQIGANTMIYSYNSENNEASPIVIKEGALIGAGCIIFPGVIIEENEKIPALSVIHVKPCGCRVSKNYSTIVTRHCKEHERCV